MALTEEIDPQRRYVRVQASGALTLPQMERHFDVLFAAGALSFAKLFVATLAEPSYTAAEVLRMGSRLASYAEAYAQSPLAVVAIRPEIVDTLDRLRRLSPALRRARLFQREDEARSWLGVRDDAPFPARAPA